MTDERPFESYHPEESIGDTPQNARIWDILTQLEAALGDAEASGQIPETHLLRLEELARQARESFHES